VFSSTCQKPMDYLFDQVASDQEFTEKPEQDQRIPLNSWCFSLHAFLFFFQVNLVHFEKEVIELHHSKPSASSLAMRSSVSFLVPSFTTFFRAYLTFAQN